MKCFVNGKVVSEAKARVSIFNRGLLYGDGLFETMRSYSSTIFRLDEHLKRLYSSARIIDLNIPLSKSEIKKAVCRLLRINGLKDAYIRLAVSRGEGRVGLDATTARSSTIIIITKKFHPYPAGLYKRGLSVVITSVRRNEQSVTSRIKSLNYLDNIIARIEAQKKGFNDAVLLNNKGSVSCGAVANIFMIKKNIVSTPDLSSGILDGITRNEVIRIAPRLGLGLKEKEIKPSELRDADEAFFTNTLMEVMPVTSLGGKPIGNGCVGSRTKALQSALKKFAEKNSARS